MPQQARQAARRHSRRRRRIAEIARAVARVQALESRVLLASTLDAGVLTADGTGGDDDLRVDRASGQIIVTLNGVTDGVFDAADVDEIVLSGASGNDSVRIGANIIGATLNGGPGNDTLLGG